VRLVTTRLVVLGVAGGVLLGAITAALCGVLGGVFSGDQGVRSALPVVLLVVAASMPIAGYVFVLDGVLIGAGDGRYLAIAGGLNLVVYLPVLVVLWFLRPAGWAGLLWLAVAFFGVYMLARLATLGWRVRGTAWMTAGA
jgi:Na+-driven multidrug efflux pump